ncbi:MAG TPA: ABC transporter ATP-binding protein [Thermoplasmata archaeon]|nr:ABC transporter ATP-binding protein [Thermoplasmata archaeon]
MTDQALRAVDVRKTYHTRGAPAVEALRGVSLTFRKGERIALLGRNGAGKTTFLRIASTLLVPTSGTVEVFGLDAVGHPELVRPLIAVVPQEGKPFFHLTPREQIYAYLRARGVDRETAKTRGEEALDQMGIQEVADRLSITLSGGQKQRAMVATVIATEAPLLFLDEPTIGMDPFARRDVWDSLRRLTKKGCTVLLTTHYLDEAEALAERLYVVEAGRILVEGTADAIKQQVGGTLKVSVPNGVAIREELASFGELVSDGGTIYMITGPARINEIMALTVSKGLAATVGPVTLEEAFLRIVGRSINED